MRSSALPKLVLLLVSVLLSVAFLEGALRLVRDPVDFLKPVREPHPVLGRVILPGSGGHDDLGFRNPAVPVRPEIVALGDSMTYGYAAPMRHSWPSWLEELTGRPTYNMGIGGYGPAEYAWLLESRVLALEPELVLVGLYFGNDIHNAYTSVDTRPHWAELRAQIPGPWSKEKSLGVAPPASKRPQSAIDGAREWLRSHSMIMRVVETSAVGQLINAFGDTRQAAGGEGCHVRLERPFSTILKLDLRLVGVDLDSPEVSAGLEVTIALLRRMISIARSNGVEIGVVLIPSKERVLSPLAEPLSPRCREMLDTFVAHEVEATRRVRGLLESLEVPAIQPLEALRRAARRQRIYLRSGDTHPNDVGYRAIAEEIERVIDPRADPVSHGRVVPDR